MSPGRKYSAGMTVSLLREKLSSYFNARDIDFTDGTLLTVHIWSSSNFWRIFLQIIDGSFHFWYSIYCRTVCVIFLGRSEGFLRVLTSLGGLRKRSKRKWFLKRKNTPKKEFGACAVNQNIPFLRENRALRKIDCAKRIIFMQVWKYV